MRLVALVLDVGTACLIAMSWRLMFRMRGTRWRWLVANLGVLLISASFLMYAALQVTMYRHPEAALNTEWVLRILRSFTRFYPTSLALIGAAFGLLGSGAARWVIFSTGVLTAFWWSLFTISL